MYSGYLPEEVYRLRLASLQAKRSLQALDQLEYPFRYYQTNISKQFPNFATQIIMC